MNDGCGWFLFFVIGAVLILSFFYRCENGELKIMDTAPDWMQTTPEDRLAKGRCTQFLETFHDNRLLEIVKLDVAGWTKNEIADRYNITEHCLNKRINRDRKLYSAIKAEYLANSSPQ